MNKNNLLEKPSIETKAKAPPRLRDKLLFGRAVFRGVQLLEAMPVLKSRQTEVRGTQPIEVTQIPHKTIDMPPEYPGRHNLEKGRTTVNTLLKRNAQEKMDKSLAESALGKTFSSESGDFHFSSDLSGKIEGAPLTKEELNNRTPMSPSHNDIVIFPANNPQNKKAPNNHLETPATALPTEEYKIPPQQPRSMN